RSLRASIIILAALVRTKRAEGERSELCRGPTGRAPQGKSAKPTATLKRSSAGAGAFAADPAQVAADGDRARAQAPWPVIKMPLNAAAATPVPGSAGSAARTSPRCRRSPGNRTGAP